MTIESDTLRDELLALMKFSQRALPDYASDPAVQRRVGRTLANKPAPLPSKPSLRRKRKTI
jgi:hypothetical protein